MANDSSTSDVPWMKILLISVGVVVVIIACIAIYKYQTTLAKTQPMLIDSPSLMTMAHVTQQTDLSDVGREYTYNFWINIDDWSKGFGKVKHVMSRASTDPTKHSGDVLTNPTIWLYPKDNKLAVRVSTMKSDSDNYNEGIFPEYEYKTDPTMTNQRYTIVNPHYYEKKGIHEKYLDTTFVCDVANIPLQRWVMVSVIMWNRTLDVYINGMLVRSAVLPGVPYFSGEGLSDIYVGSHSVHKTFNGYISRLKYYNRAVTAKEVMALYERGPLPSGYWWNNLKHNIKLSLDVTSE